MAAANTVEVAVQVVNRKFEVVTQRKGFKTLAAANAWLDKLTEAGTLHQVLGFRDV